MIEGVVVQPLRQIADERGKVMHMLREDSPLFTRFGEVYFSVVNPGAVKAWKRHKLMTQHLTVPSGSVRFVIHDDRPDSPTKGRTEVIEIGEGNYCLLKIPPMLWYGFKGVAAIPSLIANCADMAHSPQECERAELSDDRILYSWGA